MSLIGLVILVGIVVNDAIVKVDFINQMRRSGMALREAILEAGRVRLRPIVMTTVTTVLGLTPKALGIGRGADLRSLKGANRRREPGEKGAEGGGRGSQGPGYRRGENL